jgi:UDP-N-acetylmuramoylalanine--D-glutamate ligase
MALEIAARVKHLITFGECGPQIAQAVTKARSGMNGRGRDVAITCCSTLDEAVATAHDVAGPGDIVLLSPSGTSFDAYKDFEQRGEHFRHLVEALSGRTLVG